jgi:23S rRNA (uracil1939-C5)-methyltransferase
VRENTREDIDARKEPDESGARRADVCEDVRIEALAYTGAGVAHLATGKTVFVDGTAPGDYARVRIRDEYERFARATVEVLHEPSPERVTPPCPYHGSCGGCGLQHLPISKQLHWKRRFVVDALERIGAFDKAEGLVGDIVASKEAWGYRNRIEMEPCWCGAAGDNSGGAGGGGVAGGESRGSDSNPSGGKLALGFHGANDPAVVPVKRCLLLPSGYAELPARLAGALGYALKGSDTILRRVGVRVSRATGDVELALWTEPGPCNRAFVARVLKDVLKTTSLVRVLAVGASEKRDVRKVEVLDGRGFWRERLGDERYRVSAPSFFQVNTQAAALLVERVLADLDAKDRRVADLYCGVGTFTLPLARQTQRLYAIEAAGSAVRDLRRNLADAGLEAHVTGGSVERTLPGLGSMEGIVVDPPRNGLAPDALRAIVEAAPRTLVYVSCDPTTLARDLKALVAQGFHLTGISPFDLFPQTWHVEAVARLTR